MPTVWTFENGLRFDSAEIENFFKVDVGNCAVTDEMRQFEPPERVVTFGTGEFAD